MTWGEFIMTVKEFIQSLGAPIIVAIIGAIATISSVIFVAIVDNKKFRDALDYARDKLSGEHGDLAKEHKSMQKRMDEKQDETLRDVRAIKQMQDREEGLRQNLDKGQENLKISLDGFIHEWTKTNAGNHALQGENNRLTAEIAQLSHTNLHLKEEIARLSQKVTALEAAQKPRSKDRGSR